MFAMVPGWVDGLRGSGCTGNTERARGTDLTGCCKDVTSNIHPIKCNVPVTYVGIDH